MTYEKQEELKKILVRLVPRAKNDRDFRKNLLRDTVKTITEQGIIMPEEVKITVLQDTKDSIYIVLPLETDEQIKKFGKTQGSIYPEPKYSEPKNLKNTTNIQHQKDQIITDIINQPQTIFTLIEKLEPALDETFKQIDSITDITPHIMEICDNIQEICNMDEDAVISWIMLDELFQKSSSIYKYSVKHAIHSAMICELVTKRNNLPVKERKFVIAAALTMNISMIDQQEKFYNTKEDLRQAQKVGIKTHPVRGAMLLERKGVKSPLWLDIVTAHHEMPDGTGYPKGQMGQEILPAARIVSLADIFCARVSARNYRSGLKPNQAIREIFLSGEKNIEEDIAMTFIKIIGIYPPGTLVQLVNNEIAIVARRGETANTPIVYSLIDSDNKSIKDPIKRDCAYNEYSIKRSVSFIEYDIPIDRELIWGDVDSSFSLK